DFQTPGALTDVQGLHERGRGVAIVGEVVLGNQAVVKADGFGILDLLHALFKEKLPLPQRRVWPLVKQPKLHPALPFSSWADDWPAARHGAVASYDAAWPAQRWPHHAAPDRSKSRGVPSATHPCGQGRE